MPNKRVIGVLSDLMFMVKIQEAAKRTGLEAVFVKSKQEALEQAKLQPAVMILDLSGATVDALDLIDELKTGDTRTIHLLGFVSHVQADLKRSAQEKGCDMVIARSAFSQNLPAILKRYSEQ
jgi:CheY-like chemotaxis protein